MEEKTYIKETVRYFWRHARQYPVFVLGIALSIPVATLLLTFIPPLIVSHILQRLSSGHFVHGQLGSFAPSLVLYGIVSFVGGVAAWRAVTYFVWTLEMRVLRDIYREVFDHLLSQSANFHANRFGGSLVSQTNKLASAYVRVADSLIFEFSTLILSFIFTFVILATRVPWVAIALVVLSIGFMFVAARFSKTVRQLRSVEADAENTQTGQLADSITNVMAVKSFAGSAQERKLFHVVTAKLMGATKNVMIASMKQQSIFATGTITVSVATLVLAVATIVLYSADIGTVFLVITYTGLIAQKLWDFAQHTLRDFNRAFGDSKKMIEILAITPEVADPAEPEAVGMEHGQITFQDMSFTHPESRKNEVLFERLNLTITAGEKIGLVGHSGSGKTTLTKLLLRFSDLDGGAILIDGQNIAHVTQEDLRRQIAYVPQEPLLFHRTIRENIAYGKPDASEKQIRAAAQKAYADEFIKTLPHGYDTLVGERGVKLSGGQRQRVVIARAILKDAPILVLDEATSALDSESEKLIQAALWELMKGRTAIVIAHRLSTIQKMDRILVLDDGKIVEEGSHQQLLTKNGTYAKLWAHQSGGFINE